MIEAERRLLPYKVGALMYVPALNENVGEKICNGEFLNLNSLAFCLEDSITDGAVADAEEQLVKTLTYILENRLECMPMLFVRVRNSTQLCRLPEFLGNLTELLTGVILPKFDLSNAAEYCSFIGKMNVGRKNPIWIMPTLETPSVLNLETRKRTLLDLRTLLDGCKEHILNIRVGAMDFSKAHGLRRSVDQTIYDIGIVRDVLVDILLVFGDTYVVSAPVWEYFEGNAGNREWALGMENEVRLDVTNGFIGKTVIHPSQLSVIHKWLQPTRVDYEDAVAILHWEDKSLGVKKSIVGNRMNELVTHCKWAEKIVCLAQVYGVREG